MYTKINEAYNYIYSQWSKPIDIAIILGSGLGPLADEIENPTIIDYKDIPHFPKSTIAGHEGKLYIGTIEEKTVCAMKGRFHYYEGHDMDVVTLPVRVFAKLGIEFLFVTNACGGIREDLNPGQITLITDHLGFNAPSSLRGPNLDEFGPRFKDMTEVYSRKLGSIAKDVAKKYDISLKEGVYAFFPGPMYETPAEIRALKVMGADMVGMSTVPEAIVARHSGMTTLGISLVTNKAAGLGATELDHKEVMEAAKKAEINLVTLTKQVIKEM
ncbi:MAG: purine-nucleoside phosphorylase [Coprobacillus sp.]